MTAVSFAEIYEQRLVPWVFTPFAEDLLERVRPAAGERMLDLACGTGVVARLALARAPGVRVSGLDVNPAMVGMARALAPEVEWREGSAVDLPYDDASFDVIVSQAGFQFFPDKARAAREMLRVLVPGGRLALSVWGAIEEHPFLVELAAIAARHLGPLPADRRHGFGDPGALRATLADAGWSDVVVQDKQITLRCPDGAGFVALNLFAIAPPEFMKLAEEERARLSAAIVSDARELLRAHADGDETLVPLRANVATARRY